MRLRTALYGLVMNGILLVYNIGLLLIGKASFNSTFIAVASPIYLFASFSIYFFFISWYVQKRRIGNGIVLLDILLAIIAELCVVILACFTYSVIWEILFLRQSTDNIFQATISNTFVTVLWIVSVFGLQFVLLGLIAGVLGWYLIDKRKGIPWGHI